MVKGERNANGLKGILDYGWEEDPSQVEKKIYSFFKERFEEQSGRRPKFDGNPFSHITVEDNVKLCIPFEELEIKEAIWECEGEGRVWTQMATTLKSSRNFGIF